MDSVVIVGAGVFGAGLADRLARDGRDVTLVAAHEPGDPLTSSGGETRLLRYAHGTEAWYARSARRAAELWRELDPALLEPCGLAWLARREDGWEAASERVLRAEGLPVERLDAAEAARLFPGMAVDDLAFVLFEPEAGVLRAQQAVRALAARAVEAGARLIHARAQPDGSRVRAGDEVLEADRVVWACGSWLGGLFPGVAPVRPALQEVFFFDAGADRPGLGWVDYDGAFYGHGNLDAHGLKVCPDAEGPSFDPDGERPHDAGRARAAAEYLARRFPAYAGAPLRSSSLCPYELTPDTHFIAAPHPEHEHVWLYGGGSGHGFKHGPALAERMAAWLTGDEPMEQRFGLQPRAPETSLRTAGS